MTKFTKTSLKASVRRVRKTLGKQMEKIILAADLGGTNLRIAAVNRNGEILNRQKTPTPT
ncbi:MAG: hypothetical protein C4325_05935, partial [Blastocatellia bacterium]